MLILMFVTIYNLVTASEGPRSVAFSEFMTDVRANQVEKVVIKTREHTAEYTYVVRSKGPHRDERKSVGILGEVVNKELLDHGVSVQYAADDQNGLWGSILVT